MTLQEAIESTQNISATRLVLLTTHEIAAIELLIEAGKRCLELEDPRNFSPMRPLPGETRE